MVTRDKNDGWFLETWPWVHTQGSFIQKLMHGHHNSRLLSAPSPLSISNKLLSIQFCLATQNHEDRTFLAEIWRHKVAVSDATGIVSLCFLPVVFPVLRHHQAEQVRHGQGISDLWTWHVCSLVRPFLSTRKLLASRWRCQNLRKVRANDCSWFIKYSEVNCLYHSAMEDWSTSEQLCTVAEFEVEIERTVASAWCDNRWWQISKQVGWNLSHLSVNTWPVVAASRHSRVAVWSAQRTRDKAWFFVLESMPNVIDSTHLLCMSICVWKQVSKCASVNNGC